MPEGPGRYDAECTEIRERLKARSVVLIVLGAEGGPGFSGQVSPDDLLVMPGLLRMVADQMAQDHQDMLKKYSDG